MMAKTMQVEGGNYGIKEEKQRKKKSAFVKLIIQISLEGNSHFAI